MKIALVQFSPIPRQVEQNIDKINKLLEHITNVDVILMPEMALTGYIFDNKHQISEIITMFNQLMIDFAITLAKRFNAHVQIGMPRESESHFYNSVIFVEPDGNYRFYDKHFLFETDELWATEGKSFNYCDTKLGRVGFGICMDVNPYQFKAPFDKFEFANYQLQAKSNILLMSMAWLTPGTPITSETIPNALNYWAVRLSPLIEKSTQPVLVCIANRTGTERDTRFIGCSCVLLIKNGKITLSSNLEIDDEQVLVVDNIL